MRDHEMAMHRYRAAVADEDWPLCNAVAESARLHGVHDDEMILFNTNGTPVDPDVQRLIFLGVDSLRHELADHWAARAAEEGVGHAE